jgi:quinoprotein dehydrogenase-associated probable ABC transporter substrate-binding protein
MTARTGPSRPGSWHRPLARCALLGACALLAGVPPAPRAAAAPARVLRVCADPNNLPFSNRARAGFEDAIANLIAADLGARLEYTFWAQRRGFFRNTLNAGLCDVVIGVPSSLELVRTTRPYYRSRYVFVSRRSRALHLRSLDDPALRELRIGIHVVGDEHAGTPPAHALARRGIVDNVVGFSLYGDYARESPPTAIFDALRSGQVDVAIVWGPLAAFVHAQNGDADPLEISPIAAAHDGAIPFEFAIAIGVRKADVRLQRELDRLLERRRDAIDAILRDHGVPHDAAPARPR